jgi:ABC-type sugar transport system substrate-binding protein
MITTLRLPRVAALASTALALALAAGAASAQDRIKIGWTSYPADLSVIADAIEGGKTTAEALGVDMEFALAAGAVAQANAVDNLLAAGIDVLAINPEDSNAIGSSVAAANSLGIPVIMWIGDNLGGGETVSLISSDEEAGGYTISKWAMEKVGGKGRIALIQGTKAHQAGLLRENGFERAKAEFPDIELAAYGEGNWMRDRANAVASDMLTREADLGIIIAFSDDMAAGVQAAVAASGASVPVTGYNGSCEVLNSVWNGKVEATLYQGWRDIGSKVVETAVAVAKGEAVEPRIVMPTYVVDRPLMEDVLATGAGEKYSAGLLADVQRASNGC